MLSPIRSLQGDRVDKIARRVYGSERGGIVERILALNLDLPSYGPVLPVGVVILLPEPPAPKRVRQTVKLWG